jgi:hypothetical protein
MADVVDVEGMDDEGVARAFGLMQCGKSKLRIESEAGGGYIFSAVSTDYSAKMLSSLPPTVIAFGLGHADLAVRQETSRQLQVGDSLNLLFAF